MVKIGIFEDGESDLIRRYGSLNKDHEVHVCYFNDLPIKEEFWVRVKENGFDRERFYSMLSDMPRVDVYFTDGLFRSGLRLIEKLGPHRTFLVTNNPITQNEAREIGYTVIEENEISNVVERFSH